MFAFIGRHRGEYGTKFLCRQYRVSTSGYYAWRSRAPSARAEANHALLRRIERINRRCHVAHAVAMCGGIYQRFQVWD
jgi:hypothetical protein